MAHSIARLLLVVALQQLGIVVCVAQIATGTGTSLNQDQVKRISDCVETTFNEMKKLSQTACKTPTIYAAAGGSNHVRFKLNYHVPFKNYEFVAGTQGATQDDGECEHNLYANWTNNSEFQCEWETSGCGFGKEGGHVRGYCSISIAYKPQPGDLDKIKEYCLAKEFGGGTKPPVNSVPCPELRWQY
jgi:hypothetical protein